MQIEEFLKLARERRSIRKFKYDPIPDEYVEKILEAGRWAMSGANGQPWEFIVIKNGETKKKLAEIYRRYDETLLVGELTRLEEYRTPRIRTAEPLETPWSDAPVIIAVLGDRRTLQASSLAGRLFEYHTFDQNMATTTLMIHLAVAVLGLGAQWISIFEATAEEMKNLLGIPPIITLFALVPIGYPAVKPTPYRRKLSELVHFEKYNMLKFRSDKDILEFVKYIRQRHKEAKAYS